MCFGIRFYKSCGCPGLSLPACPLVGMTPPPVRRYKGFPLQAAAVGTQRLCLLITTSQAGQTWTGLLFPNKSRKSKFPILLHLQLSAAGGSDPLRPDRKIDKKKRKQLFTTSLRRPFFGHRKIICDSELNSCDTTYSCESLSL